MHPIWDNAPQHSNSGRRTRFPSLEVGCDQDGGVALVTLPGISQTHHADWGGHWRWSFTSLSARALFEAAFASADVEVETHGNVLAATAFLQGLTAEDLRPDELDYEDPDYQVSILVRAVKQRASISSADRVAAG